MSKNLYKCDCNAINKATVNTVIKSMPNECFFKDLSQFYKVLGDMTRCKIVFALGKSEMCVCDLAYLLSMSKSSVSHQLNKMKTNGIVKCRRDGKEVYYSLDDDHVENIFNISFEHVRHVHNEVEHEK